MDFGEQPQVDPSEVTVKVKSKIFSSFLAFFQLFEIEVWR